MARLAVLALVLFMTLADVSGFINPKQWATFCQPQLVRNVVHEANVWIRATRYNTAAVIDVSLDTLTDDEIDEFFGGPPEVSPAFLAAAPAYAVSQTHLAVRNSPVLKRCAPLTVAEEAILYSAVDASASKTFMRLDPGMSAFLDGAGVFSIPHNGRGSGWVSESVLMLECVAVLLVDGNITMAVSVPRPLGLFDETEFVPVTEGGNEGLQQTLLDWLRANANHYGRARVEKLIAISSQH